MAPKKTEKRKMSHASCSKSYASILRPLVETSVDNDASHAVQCLQNENRYLNSQNSELKSIVNVLKNEVARLKEDKKKIHRELKTKYKARLQEIMSRNKTKAKTSSKKR